MKARFNAARNVFMIVWLVGWTAGVATFDGFIGWNIRRQLQASRFPTAPGVIQESKVTVQSSGDGDCYKAALKYAYWVDGVEYHGDRLRFGDMMSSREYAEATVRSLAKGKELTVYYDPAAPSQAVLETGLEGGGLFILMFLTPFNLIMLGGWTMIVQSVRGAELPRGVAAAAFTLLGTSFASIFVVGFLTGFNPSLATMTILWAVLISASLGAGAYARWFRA